MKYMLLIYEKEANYAGEAGEALLADIIAGHMKLGEDLAASGVAWSGSELSPTFTAVTVTRDGVVHDGPFAETHEQMGGFYMVDVGDRDAAVAWARKIPLSPGGKVEVRPVGEHG
jgi:hypothetical protein